MKKVLLSSVAALAVQVTFMVNMLLNLMQLVQKHVTQFVTNM